MSLSKLPLALVLDGGLLLVDKVAFHSVPAPSSSCSSMVGPTFGEQDSPIVCDGFVPLSSEQFLPDETMPISRELSVFALGELGVSVTLSGAKSEASRV